MNLNPFYHRLLVLLTITTALVSTGCKDRFKTNFPNAPHTLINDTQHIVNYGPFFGVIRTLDPARSFVENEARFTAQIYEPPLQYHYLKRPYTLIPLTAAKMPTITFLDKDHNPLPNGNAANVAYSVFDIYIKPHIYYQPHPAFAKDKQGHYLYHSVNAKTLAGLHTLSDFKQQGTRELVAADYVYQIKRLAHPQLNSPILGLMRKHIVGLTEYMNTLTQAYNEAQTKATLPIKLDLRRYPLAGAKVISRYHYQIILKDKYPQLMYWLAVSFFAPMPWEADQFYLQPGMAERNITLDNFPIGTGAYYMTKNDPNREIILTRNPHFHPEYYPSEGMPGDKGKGYLDNAGKRLPFIDQFIYRLDKETIPRWYKFLQGYYDELNIDSNSFDQAIKINDQGQPQLTPALKHKQLQLRTSIGLTVFYTGFNMLDKTVGGYSERARKLRQAISIAMDYEEFITIFLNGRGQLAQGPLPPSIPGYQAGKAGLNPYLFNWVGNRAERKSLATAKRLLAEAGYPNGRNAKTGKPLSLYYDTTVHGADDKARFDWYHKQFAKLGIQLQVRATQFNRLQDKIQTGSAQIFSLGWIADYPDPENFLFLFYGPNSIVKHGGPNRVNYNNPEYDVLFEKMKVMPNGPERQKLIQKMLALLYKDSPWIWGFYAKDYVLSHHWLKIARINSLARNSAKYLALDPTIRAKMQQKWNQPKLAALWLLLLACVIIVIPACVHYYRKGSKPSVKRF